MSTLAKIIVATAMSMLMLSCNFDANFNFGVKGNGNVTTTERTVDGIFNEIQVSKGLDVYITQGSSRHLSVEADDNLQDIITTTIKDNVLVISTSKNISYASSRKINVTASEISKIKASSGSDVYGTNTINADTLELTTSSGSDIELSINVNTLICKASSGSDIKLSGNAIHLTAQASSGSDIKAGNLITEISNVKASSGSDITINTSKELTAKASSGGDIKYYGNPEKIEKTDTASGNIRAQ